LILTTLGYSTPLNSLKGKVILKKEFSPYTLKSDLVQSEKDSLIVEAGVHILSEGYYKLLLRGAVDFKGTAADSIRINSSIADKPWIGLYVVSGANTANFKYVVVQGAFKNAVIESQGSILNSSFRNNHYGLWLDRADSVKLKNTDFSSNHFGVSVVQGNVALHNISAQQNAFGLFVEHGGSYQVYQSDISQNLQQDIFEESKDLKSGENRMNRAVWRALESQF
jgi:hypothetical protein